MRRLPRACCNSGNQAAGSIARCRARAFIDAIQARAAGARSPATGPRFDCPDRPPPSSEAALAVLRRRGSRHRRRLLSMEEQPRDAGSGAPRMDRHVGFSIRSRADCLAPFSGNGGGTLRNRSKSLEAHSYLVTEAAANERHAETPQHHPRSRLPKRGQTAHRRDCADKQARLARFVAPASL